MELKPVAAELRSMFLVSPKDMDPRKGLQQGP